MNLIKGIFLALLCFSVLSCQNSGNSPSNSSSNERDYLAIAMAIAPTTTYIIPGDVNDCTFNGSTVTDGAFVTAYSTSTVPYGESCTSQIRTCSNGALSGSYSYSTCIVDQPAACLFNGQTIASGNSVSAYVNSSVPTGQTCTQETRTCTNGVLSGSSQYASCSVAAPAACLFNGQTMASGQSVAAFLNSSEAFGTECQLEYRTCDNGILSGSNQYASCNVEAAASCLFNGQTIANGQTIEAFPNSSVPSGAFCISETRTCSNGVLSGSNQFASCAVNEPDSCLFNGQTLAHGQTVNAFVSSNVEYGQLCQAETRVCDNGHLSGSYNYASCDAGQATSCLFNGQTVPHGSNVTAFESSSVGSGLTCSSEVRTCENGTLSGTFSYASCDVQIEKSCLLNGQTIANGQSIITYKNSEVASGAQCEAETRTCNDGVLSGTYSNPNCFNQPPPTGGDDDDDEEDVKVCKLVVEIKHKEHYSQHPNNGLHLGWYKFKERFNCGKHKGWYKHNNRNQHPNLGNHFGWYKDKKNDENDDGQNNEDNGNNGNGNGKNK